MALPVVLPLLRIADATTHELIEFAHPIRGAAARQRNVGAFELRAMPEGLELLRNARPGTLLIFAIIGFGRIGKSTLANAIVACLSA